MHMAICLLMRTGGITNNKKLILWLNTKLQEETEPELEMDVETADEAAAAHVPTTPMNTFNITDPNNHAITCAHTYTKKSKRGYITKLARDDVDVELCPETDTLLFV